MSQARRLTEDLIRLATREVADAGPMPGFDHFSEADYDEHLDAFLRDRPEGPLHVFAYGSRWSAGPFTCESATSGLTCMRGDGRGFVISGPKHQRQRGRSDWSGFH